MTITTQAMRELIEQWESWDRCYPGNINIESAAETSIAALRALVEERDRLERESLQKALAALRTIREAIGTLGPVGATPADEHLDGPTFAHEAEALVSGTRRTATSTVPDAEPPAPVAAVPREAPGRPGMTPRQQGEANRKAVRAYFLSHVGCTILECAQALRLSRAAVSRHVSALRTEWSGHAALKEGRDE